MKRTAWGGELTVYYAIVACYFFAFGLQFVIYPSLLTFSLGEGGSRIGAAQMALSMPMFALLLFAGAWAERRQAGPALFGLQMALALPPLALAAAIGTNHLGYALLVSYGIAMGSLAAFMLPLRDAALNGVVSREIERGRSVALAGAAAAVTAVQIGAQIVGILAAQFAERIGTAPLLIAQAFLMLIGALLALRLKAPKPQRKPRTPAEALRDIRDGLAYAFRDPVMGAMLWSSAYVGVFIVGSFQVLFPLAVREVYGGGTVELAHLYACFWTASFVSAASLGRFGSLSRPGRALILAHLAGAAALLSFALPKPLWMFYVIVAFWGLASGVAMSMSRTITQSLSDPAYLGRVLAVYSMGFMGGAPIGSIVTGIGADLLGPQKAALLPGIGLLIAALALAIFSPLWKVQRPEAS